MKIKEQVGIRLMEEGDESFIFNAWLKSFRNSLEGMLQTNDIYYNNHKLLVAELIKRGNVYILHSKDDASHILGFACIENDNILHYIYIKYNYRKLGLANYLIKSILSCDTLNVTHVTKIVRSKIDNQLIMYNPWLRTK